MGISERQLRFRRWLSHDPAGYCEIATSAYGLLAMTNLIACFTRRGALASLQSPPSRVIARRAKPDVAISSRHLRIRRGFPVFRACTVRLPRLLRSLAMTNLIACFTRRGAMTKLRVFCSL